jgi:hypothetical protein
MSSEYNARKERLTGTPKMNVTEVEAQRASTPKPVCRSMVVEKDCVRKVAYKTDLEELKKELSVLVEESKVKVDSMKDKVDQVEIRMDGLKVDSLKVVLNESIAKMNFELSKISSQLISNMDSVNELKSRIVEIENIL